MNTRFWAMILAATLAGPAASNAKLRERGAQNPAPALMIEIRIHDHAQVPEATLKDARDYVASILKSSGVEVVWHRCAPCPARLAKDPECGRRRTPRTLVLRILTNKMSGRIFEDRDVYGRAMSGTGEDYGYLADVFYNRINELAVRTGSPGSLLLGIFMAHEIGHLLLGRDSHSESGIMHIPFDELQIRRAVEGNLLFTRPETERIQSSVRRRQDAEVSKES